MGVDHAFTKYASCKRKHTFPGATQTLSKHNVNGPMFPELSGHARPIQKMLFTRSSTQLWKLLQTAGSTTLSCASGICRKTTNNQRGRNPNEANESATREFQAKADQDLSSA